MECEEALSLISAEIDGESGTEGRAALEEHLARCSACREALSDLRRQDADLRQAFEPRRQAAQAVASRVIRRLSRPARLSWGGFPWLPMVLSAAAGFLVAVVIFYRAGEGPAPSSTSTTTATSAATSTKGPTVELVVATGALEMQRPGQSAWEAMVTGGRIEAGTRVRTGKRVRCEFRTPDGSEVRLNGDTELLFRSMRRLELARGQVFSSVARDDEPYEVQVPKDQATVTALGTQFDVLARPEETVLTVVQGVTRVNDRDQRELGQFKVGERARIVHGRIEKRSQVSDLDLATSWVNEILALKGPENEEFTKRLDNLLAQIGQTKMNFLYEKEIVALGDHCVKPLVKFIQSDLSRKDQAKRVNAARILQRIAQPWAIPELIPLLGDGDGDVRFWTAKALLELTGGVTHGLTPENWRDLPREAWEKTREKWRAWWEENKDEVPAGP